MKRIIFKIFMILLLIFFTNKSFAEEKQFDKYGGWTGIKGEKKGYFHTQNINSRWWIITPEGNAFWSVGVYCVRISGIPDKKGIRPYQEACLKRYGSEGEWIKITRMQLYRWGFNTIGDWSTENVYKEPGLVYLIGIDLSNKAENVIPKGSYGYFPDVFSQEFQEGTKDILEETFKNKPYLIDDPWLLGYFLADEPAWYGSKERNGSLVDDFMALDDSKPGKKAWNEFLKNKSIGRNKITEKDKLEFMEIIAEQFSRVLHETLKEYDKYHMILGTRPSRTYPEVVRGISKYCDIFSTSAYGFNKGYKIEPNFYEAINDIYASSGKPLILGVLIPAQDTDLPYGIVKTQKDRGISYWRYLAKVAAHPNIVGLHWFQYFDPPRNCYDERAANWGLVNEQDEPYEAAVNLIAQANRMVYAYALKLSDFIPEFDDSIISMKKDSNPEIIQINNSISIANRNFEEGQQKWSFQTWKGQSKASIDSSNKHNGKFSLKIQGGPGKGWESVGVAVQTTSFNLEPQHNYKFSGWIKTKDVEDNAFIRIKLRYKSGEETYFDSEGLYGTSDWKQVEVNFMPREEGTIQYLGSQLVGRGTAWFDDINLEIIQQ